MNLIYNLVPSAHMSFGQRQDTELWNNQFPESKILGLPVSRRMRTLASRDKVDVAKKAQNHEISIYFSTIRSQSCVTHLHNPELQNALVSKRSALLSCKIVNSYKYTASYA